MSSLPIAKGGSTDAVEVQAHQLVLDIAKRPGHALGRQQFGAMALTVVNAQGVTGVALAPGQGQHRGGIQAPGD